ISYSGGQSGREPIRQSRDRETSLAVTAARALVTLPGRSSIGLTATRAVPVWIGRCNDGGCGRRGDRGGGGESGFLLPDPRRARGWLLRRRLGLVAAEHPDPRRRRMRRHL